MDRIEVIDEADEWLGTGAHHHLATLAVLDDHRFGQGGRVGDGVLDPGDLDVLGRLRRERGRLGQQARVECGAHGAEAGEGVGEPRGEAVDGGGRSGQRARHRRGRPRGHRRLGEGAPGGAEVGVAAVGEQRERGLGRPPSFERDLAVGLGHDLGFDLHLLLLLGALGLGLRLGRGRRGRRLLGRSRRRVGGDRLVLAFGPALGHRRTAEVARRGRRTARAPAPRALLVQAPPGHACLSELLLGEPEGVEDRRTGILLSERRVRR